MICVVPQNTEEAEASTQNAAKLMLHTRLLITNSITSLYEISRSTNVVFAKGKTKQMVKRKKRLSLGALSCDTSLEQTHQTQPFCCH